MTTDAKAAIAEYQAALEENLELAQQEIIIKQKRIAAHSRLSMAKDALRDIELDMINSINIKSV
ncbi:MAG TPA: hypothetical protein VHY35_03720 [Stellaceae bacterium]|jgi:hypothetical protein|nr:hypothetical protein [Stellaceae bacterium]